MDKQTTLNYFPEITKEWGIVRSFPSPSCGSRLLSQCSGGREFIPMPLYSLKKEDQGFRNFLLAYGSGFYVIYTLELINLELISSTVNKKILNVITGKMLYSYFQYFLPVIMLLFPAAQKQRTDSHW